MKVKVVRESGYSEVFGKSFDRLEEIVETPSNDPTEARKYATMNKKMSFEGMVVRFFNAETDEALLGNW